MFKDNFVKVLIVLFIAGGMSAFVDYRGQQQIEDYKKSTQRQVRNFENTLTTLQSEIEKAVSFEVLNQSIDSLHVEVMSHLESQVASNAAFAKAFSKELEGLHTADTLSQKSNKTLKTGFSFLTAEVSSLLNEVRAANKKLAEHSEVLHKHWSNSERSVLESVQTTKPVEPEPSTLKESDVADVGTASHSELFGDPSGPPSKCSYVLEKGSNNSTRHIQRAVSRLTEEANYNIVALFDIVNGQAKDLTIQSSNAPNVLRKNIHKYVSKLSFVPADKVLYGCNMKFNLQVT